MAGASNIEWTEHRRCTKCGHEKALSDFNVDRSRLYGRSYVCRACKRITHLDGPSRHERNEAKNKGFGWCAECRGWFEFSALRERWRCPQHRRAVERDRYATDAAYRAERRQHAQYRKRGVVSVPVEGQESLLAEFEGLCAYCDNPATTWDHVLAVSRGGDTTPDNVLPCCVPCNSSKRDRDLLTWIEATGRDIKVKALERLAHYQVLE